MLLLYPKSALLLSVAVTVLCAGLLDAKPRRLSDLGNRAAVESVRFSAPSKDLQMNTNLSGQRIEFGQWHGSFSSIGGKRSGITTDNRFRNQGEMVSFPMVERQNSGIAVEASERRMAPLRNVDQIRDIVIANDFDKMAPRTVEGRALQEMVDEVSLKDINRFQVHRNKTDDGVPVQRAGSSDAPTIAPKREKADGGK